MSYSGDLDKNAQQTQLLTFNNHDLVVESNRYWV